ncbi:TetR/AcrR family transcriptional regulator [Nocardia brasiliensis]|uniref:TetR/AcrR family transcriptional regulator n=1 Tax=Nocardia brasiliensis TaxID=37326 RepID=UPI00366C3B70
MADNMTASPTRVRNRRGEGARLRDDIVAAAVELLDETGDEKAVTLRSVARRVGIAAPSIYRHFPDQPTIMLAVVQQAFGELEEYLSAAVTAAGDDPRDRLFAVCHGYLEFAERHPQRYRTMFGGLWMPALDETTLTEADMVALGEVTLRLLTEVMRDCVRADQATSTDLPADTIGLWLGLHGLAHQRASTVAFPWPPDIADRMITSLAHLKDAP